MINDKSTGNLPLSQNSLSKLTRFCERWKIVRLEVFGSVARGEAKPDSDIDLMATFATDAAWSLFDLADMEHELKDLFGRKVSLVTRAGVEQSHNWIKKRAILGDAQLLYAA